VVAHAIAGAAGAATGELVAGICLLCSGNTKYSYCNREQWTGSYRWQHYVVFKFGDKARALEFFEKRGTQNMDGATIKTFEVSHSFLDDLRNTAVKESVAR